MKFIGRPQNLGLKLALKKTYGDKNYLDLFAYLFLYAARRVFALIVNYYLH